MSTRVSLLRALGVRSAASLELYMHTRKYLLVQRSFRCHTAQATLRTNPCFASPPPCCGEGYSGFTHQWIFHLEQSSPVL